MIGKYSKANRHVGRIFCWIAIFWGVQSGDPRAEADPQGGLDAKRAATTPSVVVATDRRTYGTGDIVSLTVANSMTGPVWYIGFAERDLVFWELERAEGNGWKRLTFRLPVIEDGKEVCRIRMYERPFGAATELRAHSELLYEWRQRICPEKIVPEPFAPETIARGTYRFVLRYSLHIVKSQDLESKPWQRPIELGDTTTAYSNAFLLK
jgi:hypothetical protein